MIPQARLQPRALRSTVRTSSRPALATLSEQVRVRTMTSPNRISEILSMGSSTGLNDLLGSGIQSNSLTAATLRPARCRVEPMPAVHSVAPVLTGVGHRNNAYHCPEPQGSCPPHRDSGRPPVGSCPAPPR